MKLALIDTNGTFVLDCTVHIQGDAMDMTMASPGGPKPNTSYFKRIK
jgi:hypothetical protein